SQNNVPCEFRARAGEASAISHSPDRGRRDDIKESPGFSTGASSSSQKSRACSPRRCEFYPKAHITPMVVQKMPVVSKKMQVKPSLIQKMRVDQITQLRWCDFGSGSSFELRRKKKQNVRICCRSVTAAR